jgi:diaminopimelate epimerase
MILEKYESTGNDFIITHEMIKNPSKYAKEICNRHFGIGADGIMIVEPSTIADLKMVYYNSDGSIAPMCGNGIRAFIDYAYQNLLVKGNSFFIETLAGIIQVTRINQSYYEVNLGKPLSSIDYPLIKEKVKLLDFVSITIDQNTFQVYPIFLGTLHGIVLMEDKDIIKKYGYLLSTHKLFPEGININFVSIKNRNEIEVITHERGAGFTLSCGTGVSSSAYILTQLGLVDCHVKVSVPGGNLEVHACDDVYLLGPTNKIATVIFKEESL